MRKEQKFLLLFSKKKAFLFMSINTGDTAWLFVCGVLVLMMTMPASCRSMAARSAPSMCW